MPLCQKQLHKLLLLLQKFPHDCNIVTKLSYGCYTASEVIYVLSDVCHICSYTFFDVYKAFLHCSLSCMMTVLPPERTSA